MGGGQEQGLGSPSLGAHSPAHPNMAEGGKIGAEGRLWRDLSPNSSIGDPSLSLETGLEQVPLLAGTLARCVTFGALLPLSGYVLGFGVGVSQPHRGAPHHVPEPCSRYWRRPLTWCQGPGAPGALRRGSCRPGVRWTPRRGREDVELRAVVLPVRAFCNLGTGPALRGGDCCPRAARPLPPASLLWGLPPYSPSRAPLFRSPSPCRLRPGPVG